MSNTEIIHAYRKLLRAGLRAVQFSKPARYGLTAQLRTAFRERGAAFQPEAIRRTVWFLNAAAQERGLEHRIVKNLVAVAWLRGRERGPPWSVVLQAKEQKKDRRPSDPIRETAYQHYEATIKMLNDTMGLCLR